MKHLLEEYEKLVYSICLRMVKNPFDAQDLTQETFLSAYKNSSEFDGRYEKAWLVRIATNKCLDYLKNSARKTEPQEDFFFSQIPAGNTGPEEEVIREESREKVLSICLSLKPPYDRVAKAHFYEEKTALEIAEESATNVKTIQTQIYRAIIQGKMTVCHGA